MAPVTAAVQEKYKGQINFRIVDVSKDADAQRLWNQYKVEGTPTYVILDKTGKETARIIGSGKTVADFDRELEKVLK